MRPQKFNSLLALETGEFFRGFSFCQFDQAEGEICFTTAMTGYQEVISDPSYAGQIVVFSFPHIGNTGINLCDFQSPSIALSAIVFGEATTSASNYQSYICFDQWLVSQNIPHIGGVDTRALIRIISQSRKPIRCVIKSSSRDLNKKEIVYLCQVARESSKLSGQFLPGSVAGSADKCDQKDGSSNVKHFELSAFLPRIALLDFGYKEGILNALSKLGCHVEVLPYNIHYSLVLDENFDGIVLSNGPGDPMAAPQSILENITKFIESDIPILGICMGFQLVARSLGINFIQLPCGHHGINHPVRDIVNNKVIITAQNHEFVMDESTLSDRIIISHRSLFDDTVEGFILKDRKVFAYQFHPEGNPGPEDALYLFDQFNREISRNAKEQ